MRALCADAARGEQSLEAAHKTTWVLWGSNKATDTPANHIYTPVVLKASSLWGCARAQRAPSERPCVQPSVNEHTLSAMADMGIPGERAKLVLSATNNVGIPVRALPGR